MTIFFFGITLMVLLLCVAGLSASLVLHSLMKLIFWMGEFLFILAGAVMIMVTQVTLYGNENLYFTFLMGGSIFFAFGYWPLVGIWREKRSFPARYGLSLVGTALACLVILLRWIGVPVDYFYLIPALSVIVPSVQVILFRKKLIRKEYGDYLVRFALLSLLGYAFEFLEYFLRKSPSSVIGALPVGFLSFTGFSLVLALTALFFCLKIISALKGQLKGSSPTEEQIALFCRKNELTKRESQIIGKLLLRFTHREIGEMLGISPRTVERHVYNVYQKTGISNRFELYDLIRYS